MVHLYDSKVTLLCQFGVYTTNNRAREYHVMLCCVVSCRVMTCPVIYHFTIMTIDVFPYNK